MNGLNLSNIQDAKLGGTQVSAIYFGSNQIWELDPYIYEYFCIECKQSGNMELKVNGTLPDFSIQISRDKTSWETYTFDSSNKSYSFLSGNNRKYYIRATNSYYATSLDNYFNIKCTTGNFIVYGNIMSLIYGDNFAYNNTISSTYVFNGLFMGSTNLSDASNLKLPSLTLTSYCYANMFRDCTSLTAAPELPATTLADRCYNYMFHSTSSLTTPPTLPAMTMQTYCYCYMFEGSGITSINLPATTLADSCYANMLCYTKITTLELPATSLSSYTRCYRTICYGCTSLTSVNIKATTLTSQCLNFAFYGCTNLNYIKAMFTTTPGTSYTGSWVYNVKSSGTFVKNSLATWNVTGNNGVPSGWTVQTASE